MFVKANCADGGKNSVSFTVCMITTIAGRNVTLYLFGRAPAPPPCCAEPPNDGKKRVRIHQDFHGTLSGFHLLSPLTAFAPSNLFRKVTLMIRGEFAVI